MAAGAAEDFGPRLLGAALVDAYAGEMASASAADALSSTTLPAGGGGAIGEVIMGTVSPFVYPRVSLSPLALLFVIPSCHSSASKRKSPRTHDMDTANALRMARCGAVSLALRV